MTRINSLYGSQTSPVVLCMQNSAISTRIISLYGYQLSSVVFACKRAPFGSELQVSMGHRHHLCFFAFKTATLAPELHVTMGPSPHQWLLHAKERHLDQNYKSLWVPDFACCFVNAKQRAYILNDVCLFVPCLHLWSCAFKTAPLASELLVSMGASPHLSLLHSKQRL